MENRDDDLKALENNLDGEVNQDQEEETKGGISNSALDITNSSQNFNTSTTSSSIVNPEAAQLENATEAGSVDQTKVISDYLLTKLFENID